MTLGDLYIAIGQALVDKPNLADEEVRYVDSDSSCLISALRLSTNNYVQLIPSDVIRRETYWGLPND